MAVSVLMPKQGNSVESCVILDWVKKEGDSVAPGEVLCEAETDKATIEIESPAGGILLKTFFDVDADVPVQTMIAVIGEAGEDISEFLTGSSGAAEDSSVNEVPSEASPDVSVSSIPSVVSEQSSPSSSVGIQAGGNPVSPRARNTARDKGVDSSVLTGTGPGGRVIERDVLSAAASGAALTPAARAAAAGKSIPASGTGLGGRVRLGDLGTPGADVSLMSPAGVFAGQMDFPGPVTETAVKGVRKLIAGRMIDSLSTTAQLTNNTAADVSSILAYRKKCKASDPVLGVSGISLNDIFLYLVSRVLKSHPVLNSHWLGDRYLSFERVHLGFAVDTPRGLLVPVIRNADLLTLKQISAEAGRLASASREGKIQPEELSGATFTISNLGAMGIESFTPIINPPEVGILGICSSVLRPVQGDGDIVFKPYSGLSLTYDHQLVDGAPASRFLVDLKKAIENFDLFLAG
ncbi:MAG: 2-oxo acid dehydrogenase subunit E2 [Spirochaetales bacterium]|nr:2-oxo acid dehydrogenase subunit E2 [Spirochaetales bacterium]